MAALEEWLQGKYVEFYNEAENYNSKPEMLSAKIPNLLLKDGTRDYIEYNGDVYYLINKSVLPEEIKDGLVGGNSNTFADYIRLYDVYGVTKDLKVYYIDKSTETTYGSVDVEALPEDLVAASIKADNVMNSAIKGTLAGIGVAVGDDEDVKLVDASKLKDLSLDGSNTGNANGLTSLSSLSDIRNLQTLTLSNLNLYNLDGLQYLTSLYYIYFRNCTIEDYSALQNNWNLKYIYMYLPPDMLETTANNQVKYLSNGLKNANNLTKVQYFGICGIEEWFKGYTESSFVFKAFSPEIVSNVTTISSLKDISQSIRNTTKYIYMTNNQFQSIDCFYNWNQLSQVNVTCNSQLKSLDGLSSSLGFSNINASQTGITKLGDVFGMNSKTGLAVCSCLNLTKLDLSEFSDIHSIWGNDSSLADISDLEKIKNKAHYFGFALKNTKLISVAGLANLSGLKYLVLEGVTTIPDEDMRDNIALTGIAERCGKNFTYASKYAYIFSAYETNPNLSTTKIGKKLTSSSKEWINLKGRTTIIALNLSGQDELTDDDLQGTLKTLTGLKYLSLNGCSKLASINFIGIDKVIDEDTGEEKEVNKVTDLYELDIRGTASTLTDLSNLENSCSNLLNLIIDNTSTQMNKIQNTINRVSRYISNSNNYNFSTLRYGMDLDNSWIKKNCWAIRGLVLGGNLSQYSFNGCTLITSFHSHSFNISKSGSLDLSGCSNLEIAVIQYMGGTVKLPKSIVHCELFQTLANFSLCDNLEDLTFWGCNYTDSYDCMKNAGFKKIKKLRLWRTKYEKMDFLELDSFKKLTNLYIGSDTWDSGTPSITNLSCLKNLSELTILNIARISTLTNFSEISNLTQIQKLTILECNSLGNLDVSKLKALITLNVSSTKVTGLIGLDKISNNFYLSLSSCSISNLTDLGLVPKIKYLDLSYNSFSDLTELEDTIFNDTINYAVDSSGVTQVLNLSNTSISANQTNITVLQNLKNAGLKKINIQTTPLASDSTYLAMVIEIFGSANVER